MTDFSRRIATELLRIEAVLLRPEAPFTWASGIESPIYTDNRLTLGHVSVRRTLREGFAAVLAARGLTPDVLAGTATAGIPHAAWLAEARELPMVYVRSKPKGHGRGNLIEGPLAPGQRVVVIEDLVSTGGSSIDAVRAVREAGADVLAVLAIFTYNLDRARIAFAEARVPLYALTDLDTLLDVAVDEKRLEAPQRAGILQWRAHLNKG